MLLGSFHLGSARRAAFGLIANQVPKPAAFTFDFRSATQGRPTKMEFADGEVTKSPTCRRR